MEFIFFTWLKWERAELRHLVFLSKWAAVSYSCSSLVDHSRRAQYGGLEFITLIAAFWPPLMSELIVLFIKC